MVHCHEQVFLLSCRDLYVLKGVCWLHMLISELLVEEPSKEPRKFLPLVKSLHSELEATQGKSMPFWTLR